MDSGVRTARSTAERAASRDRVTDWLLLDAGRRVGAASIVVVAAASIVVVAVATVGSLVSAGGAAVGPFVPPEER